MITKQQIEEKLFWVDAVGTGVSEQGWYFLGKSAEIKEVNNSPLKGASL